MQQTIVAVFDNRNSAQQAMSDLLAEGFSQENVRLSEGSTDTAGMSGTTGTAGSGSSGFMNFFRDLFGSDDNDDARVYSTAVSRGNCVLTVDASSDSQVDRATDILDNYNPIDIDEHASQWGFTSYGQDSSRTGMGAQSLQSSQQQGSQQFTQTQSASQSKGSYSGAQLNQGDTKSIPVIQEELRVGKREVQRGGVRVYSRVVETPVHESVNLREEHVTIERRPVDRAVSADDAAFKEGSIELRETSEEAVVNKQAKVVEEVVVGKQVTQRNQQIDDTVRRTEVEVDKLAGDQTRLSDADDDNYFRTHWNSNYASSGGSYDDYAPAYRFGSTMRGNEHYRGRSWDEAEPNLRSSWEMKNTGSPWEKFKAAVRHGWDRMTD